MASSRTLFTDLSCLRQLQGAWLSPGPVSLRLNHSAPQFQDALAEAEDELRVVGHPVRRPRRVERELQLDVLNTLDLADGAVDVLRDERAGGTAHRSQAVRDLGGRVVHLDVVEEAEVDDV